MRRAESDRSKCRPSDFTASSQASSKIPLRFGTGVRALQTMAPVPPRLIGTPRVPSPAH